MTAAVAELLDILDLEPLEHNLFRGRSPKTGWQRVFGGQVIGQALVAAQRTVDPLRHVHSLHGYFMRPGDPAVPIIYEVDRIRDGGSFTTRRVVAIQHGHAIFSMSASFQVDEPGLDYQAPMPDKPKPEALQSEQQLKDKFLHLAPENVRRYWERERPIELRAVSLDHYVSKKKLDAEQYVWMRATAPLPDDTALHCAVLAYASDMTLLDTSLFAHGRSFFNSDLQMASLDHAMWFHRPFRADNWLLFAQDSPNTSGARGLTRGSLFTEDGTLVASVAQEGLIRIRDKNR
jgi:acyl-CoA thioesterase-2